jgi:hypothetical protein
LGRPNSPPPELLTFKVRAGPESVNATFVPRVWHEMAIRSVHGSLPDPALLGGLAALEVTAPEAGTLLPKNLALHGCLSAFSYTSDDTWGPSPGMIVTAVIGGWGIKVDPATLPS